MFFSISCSSTKVTKINKLLCFTGLHHQTDKGLLSLVKNSTPVSASLNLLLWQNINWNTYGQHIINQDKYISDCLVPWQSSKQWQTALGKLKKKYAVPIKSIEENSLKQFSRNKVWKCFVHFSRFHTWSPFSSRIFPLSSTPMQS